MREKTSKQTKSKFPPLISPRPTCGPQAILCSINSGNLFFQFISFYMFWQFVLILDSVSFRWALRSTFFFSCKKAWLLMMTNPFLWLNSDLSLLVIYYWSIIAAAIHPFQENFHTAPRCSSSWKERNVWKMMEDPDEQWTTLVILINCLKKIVL